MGDNINIIPDCTCLLRAMICQETMDGYAQRIRIMVETQPQCSALVEKMLKTKIGDIIQDLEAEALGYLQPHPIYREPLSCRQCNYVIEDDLTEAFDDPEEDRRNNVFTVWPDHTGAYTIPKEARVLKEEEEEEKEEEKKEEKEEENGQEKEEENGEKMEEEKEGDEGEEKKENFF